MKIENKSLIINKKTIILLFITLVLILSVGFRPLIYFRDTENYLLMIHTFDEIFQAEPTFWLINQFNQLFLGGEDQIFFLLYAILGISIKIIAIKRISIFPLISIYLYICLYLILHEMTQIRAGVASAIFLLAIPDIVDKNYKSYFLKTAIAITFHYSAVIMIFLYFLNSEKINKKFYYFIPLLGVLLSFYTDLMMDFFNLLISFFPSFLANKINLYLMLIDNENFNKINLFNIFMLSLIAFYYFFLFNFNKVNSKLNNILIKLFAIQLFIFYAFSSIPAFAFRLSELIGISIIFLIPNLNLIIKQKIISLFIIVVWGTGYLWFIGINKLILI